MPESLLENIAELSDCLARAITELRGRDGTRYIARSDTGHLVLSGTEPPGPSLCLSSSGRRWQSTCVSVFSSSNLVDAHLHDVPLENVFSVAIACLAAPELFQQSNEGCRQFSTRKFREFQECHPQFSYTKAEAFEQRWERGFR